MATSVKVLKRPKLNLLEQTYLPQVMAGLVTTFKHVPQVKDTVSYPEEKWIPRDGYRGLHRLNKDEDGRIKCVACEMCSSACPAHCITIEAEVSPWEDREKIPKRYDIDLLRCIFCGMCEEACPEDAIELTEIYDFCGYIREDFIADKDTLLHIYDLTADGNYYRDLERSQKLFFTGHKGAEDREVSPEYTRNLLKW
ncbi:MAG: NADH-quinone oxidoreductase subunit I [Gemmatimonadetes bacterium]|nr:MAG: NADH-quinone oxidoreductase subunit I [Gemmatimonadota bacterium]